MRFKWNKMSEKSHFNTREQNSVTLRCFKRAAIALLCGLILSPAVQANVSLQAILRVALVQDPRLDEAKANISMAESQTKVSEAGHKPVISVDNTNMIAQQQRNGLEERSSGPSLRGKLNLYSWGAVESEIERDKHKEEFFRNKFYETREQLGKDIGSLYLTALRAKENIAVYQESLKRHDKMIKDLGVIVANDKGREFEINETLSRRNQVEATILSYERVMYNALSRLSRYTAKKLTPKDLIDPFADVSAEQFVARYSNSDVQTNPTFIAQRKEFESAKAGVEAAKARRLPTINLEGSANRHSREVHLNMSWDLYNPAAEHQERSSYYSQKAAEARLSEIKLDLAEKAQTAEMDMKRNQQLAKIAHKQIELQKNVVHDTELQFLIAAKSLLNVLDSYKELTVVQATEVEAKNDFREAALLYLVSQARVSAWAGFTALH